MEDKTIKKKFSLEDLKRLKSLEGKKLSEVIYFVWINLTNENNPFVFIDKIKLEFENHQSIILSAGDESDALIFESNFNPDEENKRLKNEFEGKIILKAHHANNDKFWNEVIGKNIDSVQLSKEEDYYLADAIILDFGKEKRLIAVSPEEGILIDFHEEI